MPYFKSIERYAPGEAEQRGKSGPILVEDYRTTLDLTHRFVDAAQQAGIPLTKDLNGRVHEGVGYSQMSRNGRLRGSTARTFLAQAKGRPNLRIETKAFATKLLFEGKRCVGVAFRQKRKSRLSGREPRFLGVKILGLPEWNERIDRAGVGGQVASPIDAGEIDPAAGRKRNALKTHLARRTGIKNGRCGLVSAMRRDGG